MATLFCSGLYAPIKLQFFVPLYVIDAEYGLILFLRVRFDAALSFAKDPRDPGTQGSISTLCTPNEEFLQDALCKRRSGSIMGMQTSQVQRCLHHPFVKARAVSRPCRHGA